MNHYQAFNARAEFVSKLNEAAESLVGDKSFDAVSKRVTYKLALIHLSRARIKTDNIAAEDPIIKALGLIVESLITERFKPQILVEIEKAWVIYFTEH